MNDNGTNNLFFGGIPTATDVKRIMDAYPVETLTSGKLIGYDEIGAVINEPVRSNRWRSVSNAWRKRLEDESSILIGCKPEKKAFVVLNDDEKVDQENRKYRGAMKGVRRSLKIHTLVDLKQLSDERRAEHHFYEQRAKKILSIAQLRQPKQLPDMTE